MRQIRFTEQLVPACQNFFEDLATVMLVDIVIEFTKRATRTVLEPYNNFHTVY